MQIVCIHPIVFELCLMENKKEKKREERKRAESKFLHPICFDCKEKSWDCWAIFYKYSTDQMQGIMLTRSALRVNMFIARNECVYR